MSNNTINKVVYNGDTLIDLTSDTVSVDDVVEGKTLHLANGTRGTGTLASKPAQSGGTDLSLVTTGEKYTWDNKQDALVSGTNIKTVDNISLLGSGNVSTHLVGEIVMYCGTLAPSGWRFCTGAAVSREVYADLFAVIGTTFGAGDGSTTFNLPDFRNRFPVSVGSEYGIGETGGAKSVTLTENQIPSHTHKINWTNYNRNSAAPSYATVGTISSASQTTNANSGATGGGASHENRPPYIGICFLIYTGVVS